MYISGLMDSEPDFRCSDLGSFPWEERLNICSSIFLKVLMKKQWVRNRRKRFYGECGETPFEGEGLVKVP